MRWDALFSDYEGQMNAARDDNWRAEVADRTRGERAAVDLAARISGAHGHVVSVTLIDGETVTGHVRDSAQSWVLLEDDGARNHVVPAHAITAVQGLSAVAHHLSAVERRLDLTHALRALSRDRVRVRISTAGSEVRGIIAAVHADHLDIAEQSRERVSVPFARIIQVVTG